MHATPSITQFNPNLIPYQKDVIDDIRANFDYDLGVHELMLSGSIGSAKSTLMAHIIVTHCMQNSGARALIGRLSMPALRATLFNKILEHIEQDLVIDRDYDVNQTTATIRFRNGSEIISRSWSDKKYYKVRSLELSAVAIEETTENDTQDFYNEIKMRVGRIPHVKEKFIINATNPDAPSHWAYKYFIEANSKTKHVYYSRSEENPFLPKSYISQLKDDLDPKMARRMLYGEWIELAQEIIYYAYDKTQNFIPKSYNPDPRHPVWISYDFNIGEGKPLSCVLFQYIGDTFHFFNEVVVQGMRTLDSLDELHDRGLIPQGFKYYITGDASGKNRDTRSRKSDYELIEGYFANTGKDFEMKLFASNPPIRTRHNLVNAYCLSENGNRRLFVYNDCKVLDEGLRLTALKKGASLIEDDSKHYQHITTALGYGMHAAKLNTNQGKQRTMLL
jgi:hypothetical protein